MKIIKLLLPLLLILSLQTHGYGNNLSLRLVRENAVPELTMDLVNSIVFQYGLIEEVQQVVKATIDRPEIFDEKVLAQGVVLMIAKELPEYKYINIQEFLGIELNNDELNAINEVGKEFIKSKREILKEVKNILEMNFTARDTFLFTLSRYIKRYPYDSLKIDSMRYLLNISNLDAEQELSNFIKNG